MKLLKELSYTFLSSILQCNDLKYLSDLSTLKWLLEIRTCYSSSFFEMTLVASAYCSTFLYIVVCGTMSGFPFSLFAITGS
jgi:hypothetical protein